MNTMMKVPSAHAIVFAYHKTFLQVDHALFFSVAMIL